MSFQVFLALPQFGQNEPMWKVKVDGKSVQNAALFSTGLAHCPTGKCDNFLPLVGCGVKDQLDEDHGSESFHVNGPCNILRKCKADTFTAESLAAYVVQPLRLAVA